MHGAEVAQQLDAWESGMPLWQIELLWEPACVMRLRYVAAESVTRRNEKTKR